MDTRSVILPVIPPVHSIALGWSSQVPLLVLSAEPVRIMLGQGFHTSDRHMKEPSAADNARNNHRWVCPPCCSLPNNTLCGSVHLVEINLHFRFLRPGDDTPGRLRHGHSARALRTTTREQVYATTHISQPHVLFRMRHVHGDPYENVSRSEVGSLALCAFWRSGVGACILPTDHNNLHRLSAPSVLPSRCGPPKSFANSPPFPPTPPRATSTAHTTNFSIPSFLPTPISWSCRSTFPIPEMQPTL